MMSIHLKGSQCCGELSIQTWDKGQEPECVIM